MAGRIRIKSREKVRVYEDENGMIAIVFGEESEKEEFFDKVEIEFAYGEKPRDRPPCRQKHKVNYKELP